MSILFRPFRPVSGMPVLAAVLGLLLAAALAAPLPAVAQSGVSTNPLAGTGVRSGIPSNQSGGFSSSSSSSSTGSASGGLSTGSSSSGGLGATGGATTTPSTGTLPTAIPDRLTTGGYGASQEAPLTGPGAGAVQGRDGAFGEVLPPFGSQLFQGQMLSDRTLSIGPDYVIAPGDRVAVAVWGAFQISDALTVDLQGNIFLPGIGPVKVGGVPSQSVDAVVRAAVQQVYTDQVQVYTNLLSTMPIGVYVTGKVPRPGRFAGDRTDSVLFYLSRAGGIDPNAGSFRDVAVFRQSRKIAQIDLYAFLLTGALPPVQFQDGDTIVVGSQGPTVSVYGSVANSYRFEFDPRRTTGADLAAIAQPEAKVSHVAVSGVRDGRLNTSYTPIDAFASMSLKPGDSVRFEIDRVDETIFVSVKGQSEGSSVYTVNRGEKLAALLDQIAVDPQMADTRSIYLRRKSVAERQQKALEDSLAALQRAALTATSSSDTEANIRVREAELIERFLATVRAVPMEGRVVLAGANLDEVRLEPDDVIVVPQKTQVVMVSGEVTLPQSVLHRPGMAVSDVVVAAGGYTDRADPQTVVVMHPSGAVETGASTLLQPGDLVMVLPRPDSKNFALFKDVVNVVYQVAVGAGVLIRAFD